MPSPARLFALVALLACKSSRLFLGLPNQPIDSFDPVEPSTDSASIAQTVSDVSASGIQLSGPSVDAAPSDTVPPTTVLALDGTLTDVNTTVAQVAGSNTTDLGSSTPRRSVGRLGKRTSGFKKVFDAKPKGEADAAIQGVAYLTYTLVSNLTTFAAGEAACVEWAAKIENCVFVNVFHEYNNALLDFVFGEHSNRKCSCFGDVAQEIQKQNFGGQQSYDAPGPLTRIEQSSGWALEDLVDPEDPEGYELVFGPTGGANNAPGYMGFAFIDKYDVNACAQLCNGRGEDRQLGGCAYFNIWRALVDGVPTSYTCSMYSLKSDASTAVNTGQGSLKVTYSRGYARKNLVIDGGFEEYDDCAADDFCFTESYSNWVGSSPAGGNLDASIFNFVPYSHLGHGVALFGAAFGDDARNGTLRPAKPLLTRPGAKYVVQCFFISSFSGEALEAPAKVDILWNGVRVGGTSGFLAEYKFTQSDVVIGTGNDDLAFVGGAAPAWTFMDNVVVYEV
ncbi:hypothetical protein MKEN_01006300 [Mycena kentingensis (nom. inval.)]|nr:hypothetical protein MKEN_01006300 [Mycena kentingensis (nom. inval.)]